MSADTGNIDVYSAYDSKSNQDIILLDNGDTVSCVYTGNWVFFADYSPACFWAHPAKFIFVNTQNGEYTIIGADMLPRFLYPDFEIISSTPLPDPVEIPAYSGEEAPVISEPKDHLYAVLIGTSPQPAIWYDISMIYNTLIDTYGYKKKNIFVHLADNDTIYGYPNDTTSTGNAIIGDDLDDPLTPSDDVDYTAYFSRIDSTFKNLSGEWDNDPAIPELGPDDQLFIHFVGHGNSSDTTNKISYLYLSDGNVLYDTTFARYLKDINCAQMILTMQQCFSGGFVDDVTDYINYDVKCKNRVILTAEDYNNTSLVEKHIVGKIAYPNHIHWVYGEFDFYLFSALRGWYPDVDKLDGKIEPWVPSFPLGGFPFFLYETLENHSLDYLPDTVDYGNDDGFTQIKEAFDYMNDFNTWSPTGYYNPLSMGDTADYPQIENTLPFEEDILSMSGIKGQIQNTQSIPGRNYMLGGDLVIDQNTQLTLGDNSSLYFAASPADLRVVENGELITGEDVGFFGNSTNNITIGGGLQLGNNNSFFNLYTTESFGGLHLNNVNSHISINNADFVKSGFTSHCDSLNISTSSFDDCSKIFSHKGTVYIDGSTSFNKTWLYLENTEDNNNTATVTNCNFTSDNTMIAIELWNYNQYYISNNTIDGYYNGIQLLQSGYGDEKKNMIRDNTITNCVQRGIMAFGTKGSIYRNHISNNSYGVWFGNHSSMKLRGYSDAVNPSQSQVIRDNELYEVFATQYSFPFYFRYNVIVDDDNTGAPADPLVYHSGGDITTKNVRYNCWEEIAGSFDAEEDLFPGGYYWEPILCPGSSNNISPNPDEDMYEVANNLFEAGDYTGAKDVYEMLIDQYPQSKFAKAAMQELFALENFVSNSYNGLKQYYENNTNPELSEIREYLVAKCDIKLENWPDAISHYENIILNPETLEDSIFAIIDLGYVYFAMENSGYKAAYTGNLVQNKPKSKEQFFDNRNYLLSLIPGDKMSETIKGNIARFNAGELLQNIPNPFSVSTQFWYKLESESIVQLNVYNYTGQSIKSINEGTKTKGTHQINFDATGLKNGIYFYSININGHKSDSKKMTIIE